MRIKNNNLNLSEENKKISFAEELDTPLESYYHAATNCSLYDINGEKFALFLEDMDYLKNEDYLQNVHTVKFNEIDRLDKISYQYYNTPELWWLIARVNHCDPFELYEGQKLMIPNLRAFDLFSMNKDNFVQKSTFS